MLPDVRTDWGRNLDAVLAKNFVVNIGDRTITTQFRWEVFNVFNTPQFSAPSGSVTSQQFGVVTSTANAA